MFQLKRFFKNQFKNNKFYKNKNCDSFLEFQKRKVENKVKVT